MPTELLKRWLGVALIPKMVSGSLEVSYFDVKFLNKEGEMRLRRVSEMVEDVL